MIALMTRVFLVVPFIAPYNVANVGLTETELPYIYFAGGLTTLFTAQLIGWLADRYGKKRVFTILAFISLVPIVVMTHLPRVSLALGHRWRPSLFFVFVPGRFGPAMALVTGSVAPRLRGSFMSFKASVQQLGSGVASLVAGLIIGRAADGSLTRYDWVGALAAGVHAAGRLAGLAHPRSCPTAATGPTSRYRSPCFGRRRVRAGNIGASHSVIAPRSPPMIIPSLLDTDLYKFTMMQVVQHHFAEAQVEYRFKCRNAGVDLSPYVAEIEEEIRALCDAALHARRARLPAQLALLQERLRRPARALPSRRSASSRSRAFPARRARSTSRSRGRGCTRSCSKCRCSRSCRRSTTATCIRSRTSPKGARRLAAKIAQANAVTDGRLPHRRLRHAAALLAHAGRTRSCAR